jgi:hypothetical protein
MVIMVMEVVMLLMVVILLVVSIMVMTVKTDDDGDVQFTCDYFYLQKRNTKSAAPDAAGKPTGFLNNATEHGNSSASDDDGKTIKTSGVA